MQKLVRHTIHALSPRTEVAVTGVLVCLVLRCLKTHPVRPWEAGLCDEQQQGLNFSSSNMPRQFRAALPAVMPSLAYGGMQSVLDPKGNQAEVIADISWLLFIGGAVIFVVVMLLLALALFAPQSFRRLLGKRALIVGGGIAFPVMVLTGLLVYTLNAASALNNTQEPPAARIEVTGELWWWRVRYLDENGAAIMETANEIRVPAGQTVELLLKSDNVIHSFWVPNLAGKTDMIPGHVNRLRVTANAVGIYRGQCAEYCGAQHANMALYVAALSPTEYDNWLTAQQAPARKPDTTSLRTGQQYFAQACGRCHSVRGTEADGRLGPDLTHVGSRLSLAAGMLPNNMGALAGWIAGSQHIKPENKMPSFNQLSGKDLRTVAAYLESLK